MKKKIKKKILIGIAVVSALFLIAYFGGYLSIFGGSIQINCVDKSDFNKWDCSQVGGLGVNSKIDRIVIREPSSLEQRVSMICEKMPPSSDACNDWDLYKQTGKISYQYSTYEKLNKINQIIVIKGVANSEEITFYGFGDVIDREFKIIDPYPNKDDLIISPISIEIFFKEINYTESSLCQEFKINCPVYKTFYRFVDNKCDIIGILEKERLNNDYLTLSDCQLNIKTEEPTQDKNGSVSSLEEKKQIESNVFLLYWGLGILGAVILFVIITSLIRRRR